MTQDRRVLNLGFGARQQQVDDRYQVPCTDCLSFDGTKIEETNPLIVMVANGVKMVTDSKCNTLQFQLLRYDFTGDFRLLQIQGYDLILGLD
jgi:hypothetical protein